MVPSSSGKDAGLSRRKPGFKPPWDYQNKNRRLGRNSASCFRFYKSNFHPISHLQDKKVPSRIGPSRIASNLPYKWTTKNPLFLADFWTSLDYAHADSNRSYSRERPESLRVLYPVSRFQGVSLRTGRCLQKSPCRDKRTKDRRKAEQGDPAGDPWGYSSIAMIIFA